MNGASLGGLFCSKDKDKEKKQTMKARRTGRYLAFHRKPV
jgi:hypothetical protein